MISSYPRWILWLVPVAFDFAVAALAVWLVGTRSQEYWPQTIFVFIAFLAGQFALAAYTALKHWVLFFIFDRERVTRLFNRSLHQNSMPEALPFEDTMEYLARVQTDESLHLKQRLSAAFTMGELNGIKSLRPLTSYLMALLSLDKALRRHS